MKFNSAIFPLVIVLLAIALIRTAPAFALDGVLGRSSSGTSRITVVIPERAQSSAPENVRGNWKFCAGITPGTVIKAVGQNGNALSLHHPSGEDDCHEGGTPLTFDTHELQKAGGNTRSRVVILSPNTAS